MAIIVSSLERRTDLYLPEIDGDNYILQMRQVGTISNIPAPITNQKKVYKGPIGIIPSYVTVYNDYKSKAIENFRIYGREYVKSVVNAYFAEYISYYQSNIQEIKYAAKNRPPESCEINMVKTAKSTLDKALKQIEIMKLH